MLGHSFPQAAAGQQPRALTPFQGRASRSRGLDLWLVWFLFVGNVEFIRRTRLWVTLLLRRGPVLLLQGKLTLPYRGSQGGDEAAGCTGTLEDLCPSKGGRAGRSPAAASVGLPWLVRGAAFAVPPSSAAGDTVSFQLPLCILSAMEKLRVALRNLLQRR